jgi:hypothetical protein
MSAPRIKAESFLDDARHNFRLAAKSTSPAEIERYALIARKYLQLAHRAAELHQPAPSLWRAAGP